MLQDFTLSLYVYPVVWNAVAIAFLVFFALMMLRLAFNFLDPNPFGKVGRFSYHLKKRTDRFVYPAARFLASFRVNTRYAPLLTAFVAFVLTYFALQIVGNTMFIIDGLKAATAGGNVKMFVGFVLYALLSVLILFIFIRFLSSWFVFTRNTFLGFVQRVTDPILIPVQRLIPPVGMFDFSAMIVLIVISLLQTLVMRTLILQ